MEGTGPFLEAGTARAKARLHEKMEPTRGQGGQWGEKQEGCCWGWAAKALDLCSVKMGSRRRS